MKRLLILLLVISPLSSVKADDMIIKRDIPYVHPKNDRQILDVYSPAAGAEHPVVIWLHGGAWRFGDKRSVQSKPQAFVDHDYVFVAINYRFVPQVNMGDIAADVAKAVRWSYDHIAEYGGTRDSLFIAGHSAGAHLAALIATDQQYLKAEGLSLTNLKGCIPVDTAMYDAERQIRERGPSRSRIYRDAFGDRAETQQEYSPRSYVAKGKGIPPFLILHVASRADSTAQTRAFANSLEKAEVDVRVVAGEGKTHGTINRELGLPNDAPTRAVFEFLDGLTEQ
ncbi:MAG: alpha/beta hydrolase [Planctomycetales bacterium]|nr:alpha/beta hydrolase [Planctomycetales bacterium]